MADGSVFAVVWLFVMLLLLVGAIWYQVRRGRRLQAWARAAGWRYVGEDPSLVDRWWGVPFRQGHSRRAREVMVGRWAGRPAVSFTYSFRVRSGESESVESFHVLALPLPAFLPTLELTPERLGTRMAKALGSQDIEFESEDFNRAWRVVARDLKFAHDVIHPRLMERLLRPDALGMNIRIVGTDIVSWAGGPSEPSRIAGRLGVMTAVIDSVPAYVWQDHGEHPGTPPWAQPDPGQVAQ